MNCQSQQSSSQAALCSHSKSNKHDILFEAPPSPTVITFPCRRLRTNGVTCVFLYLVFLSIGFPATSALAQTISSTGQVEMQQRLISIAPNSVEGARTIQSLLSLPPDTSFNLFKDAWQRTPSPETRLYLLNMVQDHPRVLDLLDMGVKDTSLFVQNRALQALEMYSFESYAEDFSAYDKWRLRQANRSLEETMRESCHEYVQSVIKTDEASRFARLSVLQRIAYNLGGSPHARERRKAMLESGLPEALADWAAGPTTAWTVFAVLRNLKMDEPYLRKVLMPFIQPNIDANFRRQALGVLATPDNRWASDVLLKMFVKEYPDPDADNVGYSLTQMGEPRVIPTLIAMIDGDKSPDGQRVLGNILNLITGNTSGVLHDADWWRKWWTRNAARFSADVRALPIPRLVVRQRPAVPGGVQGPEQHQIAGDFKKTYWLVSPVTFSRGQQGFGGPPGPPGGPHPGLLRINAATKGAADNTPPGLLVVLPPDGNGSSAALFWQNVEQKALRNGYLVAVAVAPKWTEPQPTMWITVDSLKQVKEAKFTTEKFAADIVQDVMATHSVDRNRIYLHGTAESGPAAYACALDETTPFKGFYILGSTFKSANLPPLARAKSRRFLLQHSSDDKATPYVMTAAAQKVLTEHGATVKLESIKGTHGYLFTDPNADPIGEAIAWLDGSRK